MNEVCVCVCTCARNVILLSNKKEVNLTIYNMAGPWQHYAKWNKPEKDKYCVILLFCEI